MSDDPEKPLSRKQRVFLNEMESTGSIEAACKAVNWSKSDLFRERRRSPAFSLTYDSAITSNLETEAYRRAVEGVAEPITWQGEIKSYVPKFSDGLLQFLLRGNRPDKYDPASRVQVEHKGNVGVGIAMIPMTAVSVDAWQAHSLAVHKAHAAMQFTDEDFIKDEKGRPLAIEPRAERDEVLIETPVARITRG